MTVKQTSADPATGPAAQIAAIDIGSNSFHLLVAREEHGQLHVLDRDRSQVMLAAGLRPNGTMAEDVAKRALHCLARFGERVRDMPRGSVRAVGTNTLRQINDGGAFQAQAEAAIGQPIEIVSGVEEARLVYLGVSHHTPEAGGRQLVVDIGGGSTECIIGEGFEPLECASLDMGCVRNTLRDFKGGKITDNRFDRAVMAAQLELRAIKRRFRALGWTRCLGSSGTIRAIAALGQAGGGDGSITLDQLINLRRACVAAGSIKRIAVPGIPEDRAQVLPGGVAILIAVFRSLRIDVMTAASGALREGVLYDMIGRNHHEDVRDRTIRMFSQRYHVDADQAARVERTARMCFEQVKAAWQLEDDPDGALLAWACQLHELGRTVSYSGHHRHGGYLVEHADMAGFSMEQQRMIATLIRGHRRKLSGDLFDQVPAARKPVAQRLLVILRVAALLNRSRSDRLPANLTVEAADGALCLVFPDGWLHRHVMTHVDLSAERKALRALGVRLTYR